MADDKRAGKYVSMLLRHHPEEAGIIIDEHGWTDVEELVKKAGEKYPEITEAFLHRVAIAPDKQRYEFSEDGKRIRAVHGHSIAVDLGYDECCPPDVLYHGSAEKYREAIETEGLKKQFRQYVHLSESIDAASAVGRRHGKLVLWKVKAKELYESGMKFFRSTSGVWLVDAVSREYLEEITEREV